MKPKDDAASAELRGRAESALLNITTQSPESLAALSPAATGQMLHELRVHQIELEMQNEELRRAKVELDVSRARYFDLYDLAPVGYVTVSEVGLILHANLTAATLLGVTRRDLVTQRLSLFIRQEDSDKFYWLRSQLLATGELQSCELRMTKGDGSTFWAHLAGTIAPDEGGAAELRVVLSDITARRQAQQEREVFERKMQETQRLESLGVLAGGIAHDFNNLLMGVLGHSELAELQLPPESPARAALRHIITAAERAAELTTQMLAYAGHGKFDVQVLNLSKLVEEIGHLLKVSISKNVVLNCNLAENLPAIEADASQIRQVVMNLIINASEAIGEKSGVVRISTSVMEADHAYLSTTYLD